MKRSRGLVTTRAVMMWQAEKALMIQIRETSTWC